jgi:hypothetical protein
VDGSGHVYAGVSIAVQNHPELVCIIEAWPTLPNALRAGILAMVKGVCS